VTDMLLSVLPPCDEPLRSDNEGRLLSVHPPDYDELFPLPVDSLTPELPDFLLPDARSAIYGRVSSYK